MNPILQWLLVKYGRRSPAVVAAYRQLLNPESADGRLILSDLARFCRATETSFTPNDSHATAFLEGSRNVWLHVCRMLDLDPLTIAQLTAEITDDRNP